VPILWHMFIVQQLIFLLNINEWIFLSQVCSLSNLPGMVAHSTQKTETGTSWGQDQPGILRKLEASLCYIATLFPKKGFLNEYLCLLAYYLSSTSHGGLEVFLGFNQLLGIIGPMLKKSIRRSKCELVLFLRTRNSFIMVSDRRNQRKIKLHKGEKLSKCSLVLSQTW
jgi:hypothetical protein